MASHHSITGMGSSRGGGMPRFVLDGGGTGTGTADGALSAEAPAAAAAAAGVAGVPSAASAAAAAPLCEPSTAAAAEAPSAAEGSPSSPCGPALPRRIRIDSWIALRASFARMDSACLMYLPCGTNWSAFRARASRDLTFSRGSTGADTSCGCAERERYGLTTLGCCRAFAFSVVTGAPAAAAITLPRSSTCFPSSFSSSGGGTNDGRFPCPWAVACSALRFAASSRFTFAICSWTCF
mmetsp:Transcript_2783/g.8411  ORF Transcript_2783/g.8411 Transcript_2783/m.8411 type:complete len:238 (+) Transcript_2783:2125-2838(+)